MKMLVDIDGENTCIQVVKRGDTVYIRRCAYTMFHPTERQLKVRRNVAQSAIVQFDENEMRNEHLTREDINYAVREAFFRWQRNTKPKSDLEQALENQYGSEVRDVKEGYYNMKKYNR